MSIKVQVTPRLKGQVAATAPINVSQSSGTYTISFGAGAVTVIAATAFALAVGANGVTNPTFQVDTSAASVATGIKVTGAAAGSGVTIEAISTAGTVNEGLAIKAKGAGTLTLNTAAGGGAVLMPSGKVGIGGTAQALAPPVAGLWIDGGSLNITNGNTNLPFADQGGIHIGMPYAKNQTFAGGGYGTIKIFSNDGNSPETYLQGTIALITDPTAVNRRLKLECREQGTGSRAVTINEGGGPLVVGAISTAPADVLADDFVVQNLSTDTGITILSETSSTVNIFLGNTANAAGGQIRYLNTGAIMYFATGGAEQFRMASNNYGFGVSSWGTNASRVIGVANGTAPTTSPAGMGQLYVLAGALRYRGSGGTDSLVAAA